MPVIIYLDPPKVDPQSTFSWNIWTPLKYFILPSSKIYHAFKGDPDISAMPPPFILALNSAKHTSFFYWTGIQSLLVVLLWAASIPLPMPCYLFSISIYAILMHLYVTCNFTCVTTATVAEGEVGGPEPQATHAPSIILSACKIEIL